jgi:hypothetical protein
MILTKPLKDIVARMEDGTLKQLLLSLPDEITREDIVSKMDLILPFLSPMIRKVMEK